jgi:hypothetical protein
VVKRPTLGDGLNTEEAAFFDGKPAAAKQKKESKPKKETAMRQSALKKDLRPDLIFAPPAPSPATVKTLVGLTTRVDLQVNEALFRVSMERRMQRLEQSTIQNIVGEALSEWLKKGGYLE